MGGKGKYLNPTPLKYKCFPSSFYPHIRHLLFLPRPAPFLSSPFLTYWIGLSSVKRLRQRQHSIGYTCNGFYTSKDPTNSGTHQFINSPRVLSECSELLRGRAWLLERHHVLKDLNASCTLICFTMNRIHIWTPEKQEPCTACAHL